jgi:hypothetical protein
MKKKTYITDKATLNMVHRTVGKYPVRDATKKNGKRECTVTEKDWERGIKDSVTKCAAARALARSLGIDYALVEEYGMQSVIGRHTYLRMTRMAKLRSSVTYQWGTFKSYGSGQIREPTTISFVLQVLKTLWNIRGEVAKECAF